MKDGPPSGSNGLQWFLTPNRKPTEPGLAPQPGPPPQQAISDLPPFNGPANNPTEEVIRSVRSFTSKIQVVKTVPIVDAFMSLHPDVQRDLARLCDFADNPFEFEQQFRLFCESNPLFLKQVSDLLEKREVRVKIIASQPDEAGWCVEDRLEKVFAPDTRSDVELHLKKVSGDESRFPIDTVKKIPLRHILPYNLRKNP